MDPINLSLKVPAIEKLIDYGASGVGAIAGPLLAPWKASREGKAMLIAAEADAQVRQIQAGADASALSIIVEAQSKARSYMLPSGIEAHTTLDITREDVSQSIEFQTRKRLANVKSVLEDAADELGDKEVPDQEPDPDWTARFFDCVQDVSSDDLRKIWARILAGEVESPGRTSLRTLETLRSMTKLDAEMFRGICSFVLDGSFLFYDDSVRSLPEIHYSNLIHLQDCGLTDVGFGLSRIIRFNEQGYSLLLRQSSGLLVTSNQETNRELNIPAVILTTAGRELYQFVQCKLLMEYLQAFARFLQSNDCRLEYLAGVEPLPDGMIRYTNRIPIESQPEQSEGASP